MAVRNPSWMWLDSLALYIEWSFCGLWESEWENVFEHLAFLGNDGERWRKEGREGERHHNSLDVEKEGKETYWRDDY